MQSTEYKRLPNLLRKHRKVQGATEQEVGRILGTRRSRVSRWERGDCLPSLVNALKLAALYHVMVEALFSDLHKRLRDEVAHRREKKE